jgi:hypothetical protein
VRDGGESTKPAAGRVKGMGGLCALDGRISDVELIIGLGVAYVMSIPNTKKRGARFA